MGSKGLVIRGRGWGREGIVCVCVCVCVYVCVCACVCMYVSKYVLFYSVLPEIGNILCKKMCHTHKKMYQAHSYAKVKHARGPGNKATCTMYVLYIRES